MRKIIIIGGRGNGTVLASTIEDLNRTKKTWKILGFLNDVEKKLINNYPVLGKISNNSIENYLKYKDVYFYWTLIAVNLREKSISRLKKLKIPINKFATIIHPNANVSKTAKLGFGVSIHPFVNIGPNVVLGNHIQIFSNSLVGHDTKIEDYSYIASNSCVGAKIKIGKGAFVGLNATLKENIKIGKWSIIGLGSAVLNSVPDRSTVVGNPARNIIRSA